MKDKMQTPFQDIHPGGAAVGQKDDVEEIIDTVNTGVVMSDILSRESVRVHYLYSGHQSCELERVTENGGYHTRWFATVLGLI